MPRSADQKLRLLTLMKLLQEKTDENHMLTVPQILGELESRGISAGRKSIYGDLAALRAFGLDVVSIRTAGIVGYFIAGRDFELPELKLLSDAVACSKFITEKKSEELVRKIEGLTSVYEARQLQRQVTVPGRVKTGNEKIYYSVDAIHQAIARDRCIAFRYFEYAAGGEKRFRRDGEKYAVSPYALCWDNENYYLIAHYEKHPNLTHFRVDKMEGVELLEEKRRPLPDGAAFNPAEYSKKVFHMFGGEEETIELWFNDSLLGVVLDRFGLDAEIRKADTEGFTVTVHALVSPPLLGWIFSFGSGVRILSPESLREQMRENALQCAAEYEKVLRPEG
jgi:predicted DNA-binding transcriptional regulator YafY